MVSSSCSGSSPDFRLLGLMITKMMLNKALQRVQIGSSRDPADQAMGTEGARRLNFTAQNSERGAIGHKGREKLKVNNSF